MAKKPKTEEAPATPVDEELINLLQTVSKNKPKEDAPVEPVEPPEDITEPSEPSDLIDLDEPSEEPEEPVDEFEDEVIPAPEVEKPPIIEPELRSIKEVRAEKQLPPSQLLEPDKKADQLGGVLLQKFGASLDIILQNHKADRDQIENAIKFFENRVRSGESKGMTPFVEAWAKLLGTKAEINSNATSALDSVSKLLAAGKGNELVVSVTGLPKDGDLDLEALLSKPIQEDEEIK